jgi:membrane-bound lytic murein transglycosylase B
VTKLPTLFLCSLVLCSLLAAPAGALDNTRPEIREFVEQMVRDNGFDRAALDKLMAGAEAKQAILDAISRPAERVVPWFEYRERFLTEKRITQGTQFWRDHAARLASIHDDDLTAIIAGILGVETSFGRQTGRYRVLDALATLAFDYPPRADFFRNELREFLLLAREEAVDPTTALGSYAGAMGSPQFIASSYRNFAVDADGDGHRDLWSNWDDVIGSVANYMRTHGWREGEPVVVPAQVDAADVEHFDTTKIELNETIHSLRAKGARFATDLCGSTPAMLIVAQGKEGPEYRVGFNNFYVITQYNRSNMYAKAEPDLGRVIQGLMRDAAK